MAEKVKAKKTKAPSKKASSKSRSGELEGIRDEALSSQSAEKLEKTKKIVARTIQSQVVDDNNRSTGKFEVERHEGQELGADSPLSSVETPVFQSTPLIEQSKNQALADNGELLRVKLSRSLLRKLRDQAADEGISLDEFVTELLSESVVLRAWEIVERKNQMKGGPQSMSQNRGNANSGQGHQQQSNRNQGPRGNKGHRGMNHSRYQTIMEDKGAFLEYVRSQERNRR